MKYLDKFYYAPPGEVDYCQIESVVPVGHYLARFGRLSFRRLVESTRYELINAIEKAMSTHGSANCTRHDECAFFIYYMWRA
jgi:hypothetical protein